MTEAEAAMYVLFGALGILAGYAIGMGVLIGLIVVWLRGVP